MINVRIQTSEVQKLSPRITVVGVGGAGGNAVNNMISSGLEGCEFLVCNTDAQALEGSLCEDRMQLGVHVTAGLGAGAKPEVGKQAAEESLDEVMQYLDGANMAFITAGMGGGTGTGAAPVIAKACRDAGILTVGVVTKPFHFEGTHRMRMAEAGILEMQDYVDTLIVIPNQNLFRIASEKTTFAEAFKMADGVLQSGVRGVTDLMIMPGLINLDFADIRSAMLEMGKAMMGTGEADGERRATEAAESAINNPLLDDVSMKGARGVIINVTGGHDMTLFEVDEACNRIRDEVDPDANIIFGSTFDDQLDGRMRVSVVATGIDVAEARSGKPGTGGVRVTSVGKAQGGSGGNNGGGQERPAAAQAAQSPVSSRTVQSATASARTAIPARPAAVSSPVRVEDPDSDMFEQREFVEAAAPVSASAPLADAGPAAAVLRGQMYQGSFIPPRPAVPERQDPPASPYGFQAAQRQPVYTPSPAQAAPAEEKGAAQGLVLRPPAPGQGYRAAEQRRTPSLFERITGSRRSEAERGEDSFSETQEESSSTGAGGGFHAGLRAGHGGGQAVPAAPAQQGSLNIDSPAAPKPQESGDMDIPAFLRRQAN